MQRQTNHFPEKYTFLVINGVSYPGPTYKVKMDRGFLSTTTEAVNSDYPPNPHVISKWNFHMAKFNHPVQLT